MASKKRGGEEYKVKNRSTGRTMKTFRGDMGYRNAKNYLNRLDNPSNHMVEWVMPGGRVKRRYGFQLEYTDPLQTQTNIQTSSMIGSMNSPGTATSPSGVDITGGTVSSYPQSTPSDSNTATASASTGATHTMPDGTVHPGATHAEYLAMQQPQTVVNPSQNSNTIEQNTQSMVDTADDTNWLPVLGAVGAVGLIGAGVAITNDDDDDDRKPRKRNRTKEEARKVFASDYKVLADSSASSKLEQLLQIDFAKQGPLYRAFKADRLRLNSARNGWVIQKNDGIYYPYDRANFGKERGFSVLPVEAQKYVYSATGLVLPEEQFKQRVKQGAYTNPEKIPGERGFTFIDERGNRIRALVGAKDQYVPEFKNTLAGYFNRIPYDEKSVKAAKDKEEVSDAVKEALAKVAALEAARGKTDATILTPEEYLASLGSASTKSGQSALKKQQEAEKAMKKAAEEREKRQKELEIQKAAAEREKVLKLNENLGKKVSDTAVDGERYKYEAKYVDQYVRSNLGNSIPENSIVDATYLYSPGGQKLVITYTDEHAARIGLPAGFNKQEFSRETLIQLGVVPSQFGPSFSPIFSTGYAPMYPDSSMTGPSVKTGNAAANTGTMGFFPAGAVDAKKKQSGLNAFATGQRLFTKRVQSKNCGCGQTPCRTYGRKNVYKRNIKEKSFIGANRTLPKGNAQFIAHQARKRGLTARTIPAKGGYRVYLGPKRKGG